MGDNSTALSFRGLFLDVYGDSIKDLLTKGASYAHIDYNSGLSGCSDTLFFAEDSEKECPTCEGTGMVTENHSIGPFKKNCEDCNASGVIKEEKKDNPKEDSSKYCYHDWEAYKGFSEDYEYCTKCDKKREVGE